MSKYESLTKDGIRDPYVACGCCGKGLARNFLKAREPIWERCPECIKIHGPERLSALEQSNPEGSVAADKDAS